MGLPNLQDWFPLLIIGVLLFAGKRIPETMRDIERSLRGLEPLTKPLTDRELKLYIAVAVLVASTAIGLQIGKVI